MEQTTYSRKERGKSPITDEEWNRLSKALDIPTEQIKQSTENLPKNINCMFNDNSVGIQYVSIPEEIFDIIIKYNVKLEEENQRLKNELHKK